ncbi:MAG TPA: type II toxin-antitoxin system HicA family toxin [Thermoanaerobaculia bacterium]|nr:type II toxin-antitoxin system HicA family toxin [Thermoanaerobaculia bacterium]
MSRLPRGLSGRRVRRALERAGFYLKRQKGSHMVLRRDHPFAQVIVPAHDQIDTGTLASILDAAGVSVDQFIELL